MPFDFQVSQRDQLQPLYLAELDQLVATLSVAFTRKDQGDLLPLLISLQHREELDPIMRDELDQLIASFQRAFAADTHSLVSRVQVGVISIPAASVSADATVLAYNMDYSVVRFSGMSGDSGQTAGGNSYDIATTRLRCIDAGTIRAQRGIFGVTDPILVPFQLTEYDPLSMLQPVQRGSVTIGAGIRTVDQTILGVGGKAELVWGGYEETSTQALTAGNGGDWWPYARILDSGVAVRVAKTNAGLFTYTIPYQVIDWR